MMDSSVLLPEPDAPTIATVSRWFNWKSISRRISSVPVESVTDLKTCSTEMMQSDMGVSLNLINVNRRHFIALTTVWALAGITPSATWAKTMSTPRAATTILVVGDSLSAEYGLRRGSGWVALLEKKLAAETIAATVINASISGDTTTGGRGRLPALLASHHPTLVMIELGANDALQGLPLSLTQDNLGAMTQAAQKSGAKVLLLGMQVPPNYGRDYSARFARLYVDVAKASKAALVPFMLKGIAEDPDSLKWFQTDRIHPVEAAHPLILANIWPTLRKELR
jgi:acyl-CoA thioesterase I